MKVLKKQIEKEASALEKKAILMIDKYGPKIRDRVYWNKRNIKMDAGYIPSGGEHPRPKPYFEKGKTWDFDSSEFLLMKEFLKSFPNYQTRNAKSVRSWYGL